jgi:hypothetical protein
MLVLEPVMMPRERPQPPGGHVFRVNATEATASIDEDGA